MAEDKKDVTDLTERNKLFGDLKAAERKFASIIEQNTKAWKDREEKMYKRGKGGAPSNDIFTGFYKWAAKKQPGIYEEATRRAYRKGGFINTAVFAKEVRKLSIENAMKGPLGKIARLYTQNRFAQAFGKDFAERFSKTPLGAGFNSLVGVFRGKKKEADSEKEKSPEEQSATSLKEIKGELVNANYANMFVIKSYDSLISIQENVEAIKQLMMGSVCKVNADMQELTKKSQELMVYPLEMLLENSNNQLALTEKSQELMVYPLDQMLENSNNQLALTNGSDIENSIALRNSEEKGDLLLEAVITSGDGIEKALKGMGIGGKGTTEKKGSFLDKIMDMFKSIGPLLASLGPLLASAGPLLLGLGKSMMSMLGPGMAIALAGAAGYAVGTWLDKKLGISDAISRAVSGGNTQDRIAEMAAQKQEANLAGLKTGKKAIGNIEAAGGTTEQQIAELEKRKRLALDMARQKQQSGDGSDENLSNIQKSTKVAAELQKEINKLKSSQVEGKKPTTGAEMTALYRDNANQAAGAVMPVSLQGGSSSSNNTNNVTTVVQSKSLNRSDLASYGRMHGVHAW
jgi:hypothetical protein